MPLEYKTITPKTHIPYIDAYESMDLKYITYSKTRSDGDVCFMNNAKNYIYEYYLDSHSNTFGEQISSYAL